MALGTGGDGILEARIRAQGKGAEYAPMGLILLEQSEPTAPRPSRSMPSGVSS
ncbi:hypothetical protein ACFQ4E_19780 [Litorisediminicola beolgyonensis]|uniref:Uncharacterized protein n=1 Tax=Litorisediminicola beolgyonensis TaxID=1173614 RepID=A0ABW3ZNZ2_9RHOB